MSRSQRARGKEKGQEEEVSLHELLALGKSLSPPVPISAPALQELWRNPKMSLVNTDIRHVMHSIESSKVYGQIRTDREEAQLVKRGFKRAFIWLLHLPGGGTRMLSVWARKKPRKKQGGKVHRGPSQKISQEA